MIILFTILAILIVLPIYAIFMASFHPGNFLLQYGLNLDPDFANMTLSNYVLLFTGDHDYWIWFGNSLLLTVLTVVLTLVIKIGRASWRERGWSGGGDADVETADDGALRGAEGTHGPRHW